GGHPARRLPARGLDRDPHPQPLGRRSDRIAAGTPERALHGDGVLRGRDPRTAAGTAAGPVADRGPRLCDQAGGVAALHHAGIIHRDIKPENVILEAIRAREVPGLRLIDLGVARLPHMEDIPAPHAPGTPSYMAPELFAGAPGDERSDQFALGVTIYRMFT